MTILDKILAQKAIELTELIHRPLLKHKEKQVPTLKEQLAASSNVRIIAEIKRSSPSKGAISLDVDPVEQAKQYEKAGAAAISVLTDETFFNGSLKDLQAVREAVNLPLLCKDFIVDTLQIDHARAAGANIILLIVAALLDEELKVLYDYALSLDLEVLVEVHNREEMERALALHPEIIGINNRDLKTFNVDLQTTEELAAMVQPETFLVSESGMKTRADVERASASGAEAILVGETLMRSPNITDTFTSLEVPIQRKAMK